MSPCSIKMTVAKSTGFPTMQRQLQRKRARGSQSWCLNFQRLNGGSWSMEKSKKRFMHLQLWDSPLNLARCTYSPKRGRNKMDILMGRPASTSWECNWYFRSKIKWVYDWLFPVWQCPQPSEMSTRCTLCTEDAKEPTCYMATHKDGPKMWTMAFGADNAPQDLYFPEDHPTMPGWFKGMETIICECGLWPQRGLNA